jgi:hypothetical protein
VVVLLVAGIVVVLVAAAYESVGQENNNPDGQNTCSTKAALSLKGKIEQLKNANLAYVVTGPLCFKNGPTITITVPPGAKVNLTAHMPQVFSRFRISVCPGAQLFMSNITMSNSNFTVAPGSPQATTIGGGALCIGCYSDPTGPCAPPTAIELNRPEPRGLSAGPMTNFSCEDCTFVANTVIYKDLNNLQNQSGAR